MAVIYAPVDLGSIAAGDGGFVIHGQDVGDGSGGSVARAGDVNGDGVGDLIIGASGGCAAANGKPNAGDSYVVFGKASGFGSPVDLASVATGTGGFVVHGEDANDLSGWSVASAGDVNGDGLDDVIIGAWRTGAAANAKENAGSSYVVFGKDSGFGAAVDLANVAAGNGGFVIHGQDRGDTSGSSVASAGDVNGDGLDDLVIGAPFADAAGNAKPSAGGSYVVFGKLDGFGAAIDLRDVARGHGGFVIHGEVAQDQSGWSVASAGDVNGDGTDDLIIGAWRAGADRAKFGAGDSYVIFGKAGGFGSTIDLADVASGKGGFVIHGQYGGDGSGFSVASAGDVNGDGLDDLIIGAPSAAAAGNAKSRAGESYVIFGRVGGFGAALDLESIAAGKGGFVIHGEDADDRSGRSVAAGGDVNGDGFDDLIIGAPYADGEGNTEPSAGSAYVIFGKSGSFDPAVDLDSIAAGRGGFAIHGEAAGYLFGSSVASAGDVNDDGFDDLIIGSAHSGVAQGKVGAGSSYVVLGGAFQPGPTSTTEDDSLLGGAGPQGMESGSGNDVLRGKDGRDTLSGGGGDDRLSGGRGTDVLSGGAGKDRFWYDDNALGAADRILDFDPTQGDRIVLRAVDAVVGTPADDAFTVIGTAAFSRTAGELRWSDIGRGVQRIEADVDGDGDADLVIDVANDAPPISASWFAL